MPPFLPYGRQAIDAADIAFVVSVLESDYLTTGPMIPRLEAALAIAVGCNHAVAVNSGTAALHAACAVLELREGDEVIVPAMTFLATANAARYVGAEPVFADVDPDTGLMSPDAVARCLSPRTRAIIPVHLTGTPADTAAIVRIAEAHGIAVIEDAAHALGAHDGGGAIGSCGSGSVMATFSFHPVKHITTGEGGAVTFRDPALLAKLCAFRNHGMVREPEALRDESPGPWYYEMQALGHNLRMSDVSAALGVSQLGKLAGFVARRRALAARYDRLLSELDGVTPVTRGRDRERSAYHLYAVLVEFDALGVDRAAAMTSLRELGIGTQVHYIPVPAQPYYRARGRRPEEYPGALRYYRRTLSLPMFPAMADADVDRVVEGLTRVLAPR